MESRKVRGVICGLIAAITYGMNPLGALNLYADGVNPDSVLFYRYGLSVVMLGLLMLLQKQSFKIKKRELVITAILGVVFATSSLSMFISFKYMDAGIACTILFVYPVMVAIIMAAFFKEKINIVTILSILFALTGIALLYQGEGGSTLSTVGVLLIMLSALTYAIYIVVVNKTSLDFSPIKLTFYVMLFGTVVIVSHSLFGQDNNLQMLTTFSMWGWAIMLAVLPTMISLVFMAIAVKEIGSTPTAIMGALEPVTAVLIGVLVFHEVFTTRLAVGIVLILAAVILIIAGKPLLQKMKQLVKQRN